MRGVTLTGFIELPPAERPLLLPLLAEHVRLTRAEPGCLAFEITESAERPGWYAVSEHFRDAAAFEAHQARAAASPWGEATRHLRRDFHRKDLP
jgi:quinol monooxygenase YgiN